MTTQPEISLTLNRRIAAPAKALYRAWLDPATAARFLTTCEGRPATDVSIDARVGGRFTLMMPTDNGPLEHSGEYLELDPGRRIVFTWNSVHVNPGTQVILTFDQAGDETDVTLTHIRFADEKMRDGHNWGWSIILDHFAATTVRKAA